LVSRKARKGAKVQRKHEGSCLERETECE